VYSGGDAGKTRLAARYAAAGGHAMLAV